MTKQTPPAGDKPKATSISIKDARWDDLSPEMQRALAEKMLRLREYLGMIGGSSVTSVSARKSQRRVLGNSKKLADELVAGLRSKPWYKELRTHVAFKDGVPVGMVTSQPEKNPKSVYVDNLFVPLYISYIAAKKQK